MLSDYDYGVADAPSLAEVTDPCDLPGYSDVNRVTGKLATLRRDSAAWGERYEAWFDLTDWDRAPIAHALFAGDFAGDEDLGAAIDEAAGIFCAECDDAQVGARGDECAGCQDAHDGVAL